MVMHNGLYAVLRAACSGCPDIPEWDKIMMGDITKVSHRIWSKEVHGVLKAVNTWASPVQFIPSGESSVTLCPCLPLFAVQTELHVAV